MRDMLFLAQPSMPATKEDLSTGRDLLDTLLANHERCVGMAANMIGVRKRIIAVNAGFSCVVMYNPEITASTGEYEAEEGCLSLEGVRKCCRYREIEVKYQDAAFLPRRQKYAGFIAQIIQHEIDHCNGVII